MNFSLRLSLLLFGLGGFFRVQAMKKRAIVKSDKKNLIWKKKNLHHSLSEITKKDKGDSLKNSAQTTQDKSSETWKEKKDLWGLGIVQQMGTKEKNTLEQCIEEGNSKKMIDLIKQAFKEQTKLKKKDGSRLAQV